MKLSTKQITQTALLLTICILCQFFKNTSVYITGTVINAVLVITLLTMNLSSSLFISIITPITSFFITGSPIMAAIPFMFPVIMIGNMLLVCVIWLIVKYKKQNNYIYIGMFLGSVIKALFLWIMTSFVLFPFMGNNIKSYIPKPELYQAVLNAAKVTFSITQFVTAILGCVLAIIIMIPLKRYLKNQH